MKTCNITVIGGGTGSFVVLSGIKKLENVSINAIIPSTDSGGSTGQLKYEFGFLPVGDLRQCLVALASDDKIQEILKQLFTYRFKKSIEGHNLGNLLLTALRDITKDDLKSIKIAQEMFKTKGSIYPVTLDRCELCAEYENGEKIVGEHYIDEPQFPHNCNLKIKRLYTDPPSKTYKEVINVIRESDLIILGPGDLYTSIIANLCVNDFAQNIINSKAKTVFFVNLVTKFGQTTNFKASEHVNEVEKYLGKKIDFIFINSTPISKELMEKYKFENCEIVEDDLKNDSRVFREDLISNTVVKKAKEDKLNRSFIRHDSEKIAKLISKLTLTVLK